MSVSLREKAMLVQLRTGSWSGQGVDHEVSNEVAESRQVESRVGRYVKQLVDPKFLDEAEALRREAKAIHQKLTVTWAPGAIGVLPAVHYLDYTEQVGAKILAMDALAKSIPGKLTGWIEKAKADLKGLFKEADYPTAEELGRKFHIAFDIFPIPDREDIRLNLQEDEIAEIRDRIEQDQKEKLGDVTKALFMRLYEPIRHLADRIKEAEKKEKAILRDTLLGNIMEQLDILPRLNITDDPKLDALIKDAREAFADITGDDLRQARIVQKVAVNKADELLAAMAGYVGGSK